MTVLCGTARDVTEEGSPRAPRQPCDDLMAVCVPSRSCSLSSMSDGDDRSREDLAVLLADLPLTDAAFVGAPSSCGRQQVRTADRVGSEVIPHRVQSLTCAWLHCCCVPQLFADDSSRLVDTIFDSIVTPKSSPSCFHASSSWLPSFSHPYTIPTRTSTTLLVVHVS